MVWGVWELAGEKVPGAEKLPILVKEASAELEAMLEAVILWRGVVEKEGREEGVIVCKLVLEGVKRGEGLIL